MTPGTCNASTFNAKVELLKFKNILCYTVRSCFKKPKICHQDGSELNCALMSKPNNLHGRANS